MRKVELTHVEVLNETEQILIFTTKFNKKDFGANLILNLALPVTVQDIQIRKTVLVLERMNRQDAKESEVL